MLSSAHAALNSLLPLWWISNWLQHSAACCLGGPDTAGLVERAFPEVCRKNWIHTLLIHNKKLSLSPQITSTGNFSPSAMRILVCTATSFTVNKVAYSCSVYLIKYCYFKNARISFKFTFFKLSNPWYFQICQNSDFGNMQKFSENMSIISSLWVPLLLR